MTGIKAKTFTDANATQYERVSPASVDANGNPQIDAAGNPVVNTKESNTQAAYEFYAGTFTLTTNGQTVDTPDLSAYSKVCFMVSGLSVDNIAIRTYMDQAQTVTSTVMRLQNLNDGSVTGTNMGSGDNLDVHTLLPDALPCFGFQFVRTGATDSTHTVYVFAKP